MLSFKSAYRCIGLEAVFALLLTFVLIPHVASAQRSIPVVLADSGFNPSMAMDWRGNIHCVWRQNVHVYGLFDSLWNKVRQPIRISGIQGGGNPSIGVSKAKVFITYENYSPAISWSTVYSQFLSLDGDTLRRGGLYIGSGSVGNAQVFPIEENKFFILWQENERYPYHYPTLSAKIIEGRLQRVGTIGTGDSAWIETASNNFLGDTLLDGGETHWPRGASSIQTKTVVLTWLNSWDNRNRLIGRLYDKLGNPLGRAFIISDTVKTNCLYGHSVAMKSNGDFIAAWQDAIDTLYSQEANVFVRTYAADGTPKSPARTINQSKVSSGSSIDVAMDYDDRFVVTWTTLNEGKVTGQFFSSDDQPLMNNFHFVDTATTSSQWNQSTAFRNGRIYAVWQDRNRVMGSTFDVDDLTDGVSERKLEVQSYQLFQNYPNPFNPSTKIQFTLVHQEFVSLSVFDILGRKISGLANQMLEAGSHEFQWDGTNSSGSAVASGIYIFCLESGSGHLLQRKAILLR